MHKDQVRDDQRDFARNQEGGTLHVRPGFARTKRPTGKSVPKGHEAFLKALEQSGALVQFEKASSGEKIVGTIKTSDKFTVSVSSREATRVLFKHDISEFTPLNNPKRESEAVCDVDAEG